MLHGGAFVPEKLHSSFTASYIHVFRRQGGTTALLILVTPHFELGSVIYCNFGFGLIFVLW